MEKLVDIMSEYPNEVEHIFSPSCVALQRCTGCCGDENLYCAPVKTANVTMQVRKLSSSCHPLPHSPHPVQRTTRKHLERTKAGQVPRPGILGFQGSPS
jgi:hypothetical protein